MVALSYQHVWCYFFLQQKGYSHTKYEHWHLNLSTHKPGSWLPLLSARLTATFPVSSCTASPIEVWQQMRSK